jgi:hypothetical protein
LVAKVLRGRFGVRPEVMSRVHSYTEKQRLLDLSPGMSRVGQEELVSSQLRRQTVSAGGGLVRQRVGVLTVTVSVMSTREERRQPMAPLEQFLWGFAGSSSVEVVSLLRLYGLGRSLPRHFKSSGYWVVRALVCAVAGLLAIAAQTQTPLLAMEIGVATPIIINSWAKRHPHSLSH